MIRLIAFLGILGLFAEGAVVRVPVRLSPFGGSQTVPVMDNVGASISVGVSRLCTRAVPVSLCVTSAVVSGSDKVEFFTSGNGLARLSEGQVLSDTTEGGVWGMNLLNRYEWRIRTESFSDGVASGNSSEFFVGFRVESSEGQYSYGWLEVARNPDRPASSLNPAIVREIAFETGDLGVVRIQPIPEASSAILVVIFLGFGSWRRVRA